MMFEIRSALSLLPSQSTCLSREGKMNVGRSRLVVNKRLERVAKAVLCGQRKHVTVCFAQRLRENGLLAKARLKHSLRLGVMRSQQKPLFSRARASNSVAGLNVTRWQIDGAEACCL